jgi:N-acetylmuramoyl-L-alanine amidase
VRAANPDSVKTLSVFSTHCIRSCIGVLLVLLISPSAAWSETKPGPVSVHAFDNQSYVLLDDLAAALPARIETVPLKDKVILRRNSEPDLVFTIFSSVYLIGQVQFRAPTPTRIEQRRLYVHSDVLSVLGIASSPTPAWAEESVETPQTPEGPEVHYQPSGAERKKRWALDRIVIDAGHGGKDPGAVGPGRTYEKTITLSIAKKLGERLRRLGIEVVHTRKSDVFIGLGSRARIAREAEGDLFISLHCNAGLRRAAGGIEVYFLSDAKTTEAAAVAERENAALEFEADSQEDEAAETTLRGIARSILSSLYLKESQGLAASVRSSMAQRFKTLDDRGVKQANFYVMRSTMGAMPSILVEMGFISNPKEEKRLRTERFQKDMADAIFKGIRSFKETHEKQLSD